MKIENIDYTKLIEVISEFHDSGVAINVDEKGIASISVDYDSYMKFLKVCEEYGIGHGNNKVQ